MLKVQTALLILLVSGLSFAKNKYTPGKTFPDLKLDVLTGDSLVSLKNFRGQMVVIDFWASWCLPCAKSMPKMQALQKKYPDIKILGINLDEKVPQAVKFLEKHKIYFQNLHDKKKDMADMLDIKGMPTVIVIDKKGIIRFRIDGYSVREMKKLEETIQSI